MRQTIFKAALMCASIGALGEPVRAQDSITLGRGAGGEQLSYAIETSSAMIYTVRTALTFPTPQTVADIQNVVESVSIEKIDCVKMTHQVIQYELYTSLQPNAAPALDVDVSSANSKPIAVDTNTDTAAAMVVRAVCKVAKSSPTVVANPPGGANARFPSSVPQTLPPASQAPSRPTTQAPAPGQPTVTDGAAGTQSMPAPNPPNPNAQPAKPYEAATLAAARPFQDSVFTVGTLGKLAEYSYVDQTKLRLSEAVADKMSRGRRQVEGDGKAHPLLDEAWRKLNNRATALRTEMDAKQSFLDAAQLVPVALPRTGRSAIKAFHAELYRHTPSGEMVLVFRGTQEAMDWISNIWLGIDLWSVEAPHYQAAFDLVDALSKQHIKPLVVGHSLGGGLAQYVGYKFGLKVVGFNSSPLPERYFTEGQGVPKKYIRLFSAVETDVNPATKRLELAPDPVSLDIPELDAFLRQNLLHVSPVSANLHLVKPDCVQSAPVPLLTQAEQQSLGDALRSTLSKGVVSAMMGGFIPKPGAKASDFLVKEDIKNAIKGEMAAPIWQPNSPRPFDKEVADAVKQQVIQAGLDLYGDLGMVTGMAKGLYNLGQDDWKTQLGGAGTFVGMAAKAMAKEYEMRHFLMPHSMDRFNRGMGQLGGVDVFQNMPEQIRAQCETQSTYY